MVSPALNLAVESTSAWHWEEAQHPKGIATYPCWLLPWPSWALRHTKKGILLPCLSQPCVDMQLQQRVVT